MKRCAWIGMLLIVLVPAAHATDASPRVIPLVIPAPQTMPDGPLGEALVKKGRPVHLAGKLLANDWQGRRTIELSIEDAAPV